MLPSSITLINNIHRNHLSSIGIPLMTDGRADPGRSPNNKQRARISHSGLAALALEEAGVVSPKRVHEPVANLCQFRQ